jgi:hypothetical protein
MLAYYVEWHLREAWAELLFIDSQPPMRIDPVEICYRDRSRRYDRNDHLLAEDRIAPYNSQFLLQRVKVEAHVFLELGLERAPRSAVCRAR